MEFGPTASTMVCKVMPKKEHGQAFSFVVNLLLGFLSLSSLLIKRRWFDKKRRSNQVFLLDSARLAIAGGIGHVINIILASSLDDTGLDDECKFYLVNYLLDLLIGVPLSYYILLISSINSEKRNWTSLTRRGFYGKPASYLVWAKQTLEFTIALALAKTLLAIPLFTFKDEFEKLGAVLVKPVEFDPKFELFFVMVLVPVTLNALQFIIFDQMLIDEYPSYEPIGSRESMNLEPDQEVIKELVNEEAQVADGDL